MNRTAVVTIASLVFHGGVALIAVSHRPFTPAPTALVGEHFTAPSVELEPATAAATAPPSTTTTTTPADTNRKSGRSEPGEARARSSSFPSSHLPVQSSPEVPEGMFGAVGDRSAIDLATAFTRAFPQAASGNPAWATAPLGAAGTTTVTLTIDESGHIVDVGVSGGSAPLLAGVGATMSLIRARAFVARGPVTRIRVEGTISADDVHDGLHGEVFAIGASMQHAEGSAFFALAVGRRIDLVIQAR